MENREETLSACKSLYGFVKAAWHLVDPVNEFIDSWLIEALCQHLEAVTFGQINRLLINIPPGAGKSLIVSVLWPAWEWGPAMLARHRFVTTSYIDTFVVRDSRRMRDLVESEWFQMHWPVRLLRAAERSFSNEFGGFREGLTFRSLTGGRGERLIIDDPISMDEAESAAEREKAARRMTESAPSRLNNQLKDAIIMVMQRLHEMDPSGVVLAKDLGYEHLMIPMEYEPERATITKIGWSDPRTYEGELLCPELWPPSAVKTLHLNSEFAFASQQQQRPAPRGGAMFKAAWFADKIVKASPNKGKRVRAWDLAASIDMGSNDPDWTVGIRVLRTPDGDFYVENLQRMRGTSNEVRQTIKTIAKTDPPATRILIPQDPGQAGKHQAELYVKELAGFIVETERPTGSKETRAEPAAAQAQAGNVYLVDGPWVAEFLAELTTFPVGKHDDQVDAFADAITRLALGIAYNWDKL